MQWMLSHPQAETVFAEVGILPAAPSFGVVLPTKWFMYNRSVDVTETDGQVVMNDLLSVQCDHHGRGRK